MDTRATGGRLAGKNWLFSRFPKQKVPHTLRFLVVGKAVSVTTPAQPARCAAGTMGQAVPSLEAHSTTPERSLPRMFLWDLIKPSDLVSSKLGIR